MCEKCLVQTESYANLRSLSVMKMFCFQFDQSEIFWNFSKKINDGADICTVLE